MDALQNLEVWKSACRFSANIYKVLGGCTNFGYRDQLGRSALSVASNIAEGYGRETKRERTYLLRIAKGSCAEAWTQLLIGIEAEFISREVGFSLADEITQISKMIHGLIAHFEECEKKS
jgi:four helix bundle protein